MRNVILRAVGVNETLAVDTLRGKILPGDHDQDKNPTMKVRRLWIIYLSFLLTFLTGPVQSENSSRLYRLPIAELEQVVQRWLVDSGFQVSSSRLEAGKVLLRVSSEKGNCQVTLTPHSPLATEIVSTCTFKDRDNRITEHELWAYLSAYASDTSSTKEDDDQNVPFSVVSKRESVVCINARLENEEIQFSGFLIDSEGSIISTAHDLKGVKEIKVILHDGREFTGHLLKRDSYRDLALIDIKIKVNTTISLSEGRYLLRDGEKLYSINCLDNLRGRTQSAILSGPPRRMNDLPLWQATMKTLPGSSGSPVFDVQGNLVAMVKGRYRGTDSVSFMTPLGTILEFVREAGKE